VRDCFPDIETASKNYAKRFSGKIGQYFLEIQRQKVMLGLKNLEIKKILEVGGGHCQLTEVFLEAGYEVWIHGGKKEALFRAEELSLKYPGRLHLVEANYTQLPFLDEEFDVAIAIRLFSHVEDWKDVLLEMSRVSKSVIFDFAPSGSLNFLYPVLFRLKKAIEKNTRTFLRFRANEVKSILLRYGFKQIDMQGQFFLPMVFHRWLNNIEISKKAENLCVFCGLTKRFGSPAIAIAHK
jgi:2-polyprenyl-3-methyl-5-hydroxy-6-metoxy-1,4-benzoquinol methylase